MATALTTKRIRELAVIHAPYLGDCDVCGETFTDNDARAEVAVCGVRLIVHADTCVPPGAEIA